MSADLPAGILPGYAGQAPVEQAPRDVGIWQRVLAQSGTLAPAGREDRLNPGHPLDAGMLFGLAGGIGFMVFTFEYAEVTTATIVPRFHPGPFVGNLLRRCGAEVRQAETTSAKVAQRNLDEALDAGRAVVVRVTRGALPWSGGGLADQDPVDLAVAGRGSGGYIVDDASGLLRTLAPGQLAQARARRRQDRNWQAHVAAPGALTREELAGRVREAITETCAALLAVEAPAGIPARFAKNFGLAGLRTWIERLRDTRTKKGWTAMFADPARLFCGLRRVHESLEQDWGPMGGALRTDYAAFLAAARDLPGLHRVDPGDYYRLGERWSAFADLVLGNGQVPLLEQYRSSLGQAAGRGFDTADPDFQEFTGWAETHRAGHFAALADALEPILEAEQAAARRLAGAVGIT